LDIVDWEILKYFKIHIKNSGKDVDFLSTSENKKGFNSYVKFEKFSQKSYQIYIEILKKKLCAEFPKEKFSYRRKIKTRCIPGENFSYKNSYKNYEKIESYKIVTKILKNHMKYSEKDFHQVLR